MFTPRTPYLALLFGFVAIAFQPTSNANASTLVAGSFYQYEDHSLENHSGENIDGIDLSYGSFADSNLKDSSFISGVFVETDFSGANMINTNFQDADMTDAIFSSNTILKDANLSGAILIGVDMTDINVQNAIFIGAIYDSTTILPFDPVAAGMVAVPELSPLTLVMSGLMILAAMKREEYRLTAFAAAMA